MRFFSDLVSNYLLASAFFGWFLAQFIKIFTGLYRKEKFSLGRILFSSGGMPSSHTSCVTSLCAATLIQNGPASPLFPITLVMAMVVIIDARGVRYETGEQAKIINRITKELFSGNPELVDTGLKELVGHTPFQVTVGAILGIGIASGLGAIMNIF